LLIPNKQEWRDAEIPECMATALTDFGDIKLTLRCVYSGEWGKGTHRNR